MSFTSVSFSVASYAAWAPGVDTKEAWLAWANGDHAICGDGEAPVRAMQPMLRRRAGFLGKMALEVAYQCLAGKTGVPTVFSSRHGDASRSVDLLLDLAKGTPLSPTSFGLSVHNAIGGLFSIARADQASNTALSAGAGSVEHAVIEACGLLAAGEPAVLLVAYDCPLPGPYSAFEECREQPFAWAWLICPAVEDRIALAWSGTSEKSSSTIESLPPGLDILRFHLRKEPRLERVCDGRRWIWAHDA